MRKQGRVEGSGTVTGLVMEPPVPPMSLTRCKNPDVTAALRLAYL